MILTNKDTKELYVMDTYVRNPYRDKYTDTERTVVPIKISDTDEVLKDIVEIGTGTKSSTNIIYLRKDGKVFTNNGIRYQGTGPGYQNFGFYPQAKMVPNLPQITRILINDYVIGANNTIYRIVNYNAEQAMTSNIQIANSDKSIEPTDIMAISHSQYHQEKIFTKQGILYTFNNGSFWMENDYMQKYTKKFDKMLVTDWTMSYLKGNNTQTNAVLTTDSGDVYTIDKINHIKQLTFPFPPIEANEQNEENLKQYCPPEVIPKPIVDNPIKSISLSGGMDVRNNMISITKSSGETFILGYQDSHVPTKVTIGNGWGINDNNIIYFINYQNSSYILLDNEGDVYVKGSNSNKILGVSNSSVVTLTKNPNLSKIKQIATNGSYYTLFLNEDGEVFYSGIGYNMPDYNLNKPTKIQGLSDSKVIQIEQNDYGGGDPVSYFLQENGNVYRWYLNVLSKLDIQNIIQISCGKAGSLGHHILFLNDSKEVYGMGYNDRALLNKLKTMNTKNYWVIVTPTKIPGISNVKSVAAGEKCSLFLLESGEVFACGIGSEMGIGIYGSSNDSEIYKVHIEDCIEIYCLDQASFFVNKYGELFACGNNINGRLGLPNDSNADHSSAINQVTIPTKVPIPTTYSRTAVLQG